MKWKSMNNHLNKALFRWSLLLCFLLQITQPIDASCRAARILKSGVTGEERRLILEEHNYLRQTVATGHVPGQPAAQNMQEMQWDDELAAKAQEWANECTFQHDPSRYLGRFTMGQNLGLLWSTAPLADDDGDFPSRIRNWFNEVQKYAWGAKWSLSTGHYSQLVWGDTNLVGCGFTYYRGDKYNKLYTCNYGPGGNVVGSKPYASGQPKCQNFGMSNSAKYPGLCKPYEEEVPTTGDEYEEVEFNSINSQQNAHPQFHYTYKTYNTQFDTQTMVGTSSSTRNNIPSNAYSNQKYDSNNNNNNNNNNGNNNGNSNSNVNGNGGGNSYYNQRQTQQTQTQVQPSKTNTYQQQYNNQGNNKVSTYQQQQNSRPTPSTQTQQNYQSQQQQQKQQQQQSPSSTSTGIYQQKLPPYQQQIPWYQQQQLLQQQHIQNQQQQKNTNTDKTNPFQTYNWNLLFKNYV